MRRRYLLVLAALLLLPSAGIVYTRTTAGPTVPVLNPLIQVRTVSGNVVRERTIPLGVSTAIDVDEHKLAGLLYPDVDVLVTTVSAEDLPGKPVVPLVEVKRHRGAYNRRAPAPPLKIDVVIGLAAASNVSDNLATITYGYETPAGGLTPSLFRSKLIGPLSGAFIDPLEAVVETPGYSAPLKINARIRAGSSDQRFSVAANPLPERIHFIEDPREDGLDFLYDHQGPVPDVKLDATADLISDGAVRHLDAHVERVPQALELHQTSTAEQTLVTYKSTSALAKPDLEVNYRDTDSDGQVVVDANLKAAGLPSEMTGTVEYAPDGEGGSDVSSYDFRAVGGGEIDSLDFLARNFAGDPGPIPEPAFGPDQFVAAATRQMPDGRSRFRAAGRLLGVRSIHVERQGADQQTLDVSGDTGDGKTPLRAIVDLDDRGPGGPGADESRRLKLDTTVTDLPRFIHFTFDPARNGSSTRFLYESSGADAPPTVTIDALTAEEDGTDGCGQAEVTCLKARIDRLPGRLETTLPGDASPEFILTHTGTAAKPDLRAEVDRTTIDEDDPGAGPNRSYADIDLDGIPAEVRGKLDISKKDVVRAAEFHACDYSFATDTCKAGTQGALDQVGFTVRDQPARVGLPARPDASGSSFVSLLSRDPSFATKGDEHFEVVGNVEQVRNVAFRQRDADNDGEADGTLGVLVDVGSTTSSFDADVDTAGFKEDPDDDTKTLGPSTKKISVDVPSLPGRFQVCVRGKDDEPLDTTLPPADKLLSDCDTTTVHGQPVDSTPLTVVYRAAEKIDVSAAVSATEPDADDENRQATTDLSAEVKGVPKYLRTDVIPPRTPDPEKNVTGRKLEVEYSSIDPQQTDPQPGEDHTVGSIKFELASRRANSLCEDPRPDRKAVCVSGELVELPPNVYTVFDPDKSDGDITFIAAPPEPGHGKLSINPDDGQRPPLRLSSVSPDDDPLIVDARVEGLVSHLEGRFQKVNEDAEDGSETGPLADRIATCSDDTDNDPLSKDGIDEKDPECAVDLARFSFDACPGVARDDLHQCPGVSEVYFLATNALVGDPVPKVPPAPQGAPNHEFSFVEAGELFRASGKIRSFKRVTLDKLDPSDTPIETTQLGVAFGKGDGSESIRAYVDRDTGTKTQKLDAVVGQAPQGINVCFRAAVDPADVHPGSAVFCDRADASQKAIEASLDRPATGQTRPDVTVNDLVFTKGGGGEVLRGIPGPDPALDIRDLADTIDILVGKDSEVIVDGFQDGQPAPVAGRVSFALQDFTGLMRGTFPGAPLPETPSAINAAGNHLTILKLRDLSQFRGSVPDVQHIAISKDPCNPADPRYPPLAAFPDNVRPEYLCLDAVAAKGQPLDFRIRKEDAKGEILSIDDAGLDSVPSGGPFKATIAKSPEAAENHNTCTSAADAAQGCRPPLLSIHAPRGANQVPHLHARIAKGPVRLVTDTLRQAPADVLSKRLDYEEPFGAWDQPGVRVKVGKSVNDITKASQTALLANIKLELPQFLDFEAPTVYSCKHVSADPPQVCGSPFAGSELNFGVESKDIFIHLAGSNVAHNGTDLDTFGPNGRFALFMHDYDSATDTILTGTPPADGDEGSTTYHGDNLPPAGAYDDGLVMPGYLDAKVFLRDSFGATEGLKQHKFVQVDGRVNHPLNLAMRIYESDPKGRGGTNRSGQLVPGKQFSMRNAPCAGRPACGPYAGQPLKDPNQPSFRVRAEVLRGEVKPAPARPDCKGIPGLDNPGTGVWACVITPSPDTTWMNLDANFDPPGAGDPARVIEAVADQADKQFDLRAFRNFNEKTTVARFTPQAALRQFPFDVTARIGASAIIVGVDVSLSMRGDLIVKALGLGNTATRLSQGMTALRLKSEGGTTRITTDLRGHFEAALTETINLLFGTISLTQRAKTLPLDAPIFLGFEPCGSSIPGLFGDINKVEVTNTSARAVGLLVAPAGGIVGTAFSAASPLVAIASCIFADVPDTPLVNNQHPAPFYNEPNRPVDGIGKQDDQPSVNTPVLPVTEPAPRPVRITEPQTRCGTIRASELKVEAKITVGAPGQLQPAPVPGTPPIACDGKLTVHVDKLILTTTGSIDASAIVREKNPPDGVPVSGLGGGAGHVGKGGRSGSLGLGGAAYGDAKKIDLGAMGAAGSSSARAGSGGGAIEVLAEDSVEIQSGGQLLADGEKGADAPGTDCGLTAAGGGSGGSIRVVGNHVTIHGADAVSADGGAGGNGGQGGGGGSGGLIRIDTVIEGGTGDVSATGGKHGTTCDPPNAQDGEPGKDDAGVLLKRAATVTVSPAPRLPWVRDHVNLSISAIQQPGADNSEGLTIHLCHREIPLTSEKGLLDPLLDPQLPPQPRPAARPIGGGPNPNEPPVLPPLGDECLERQFHTPSPDGVYGDTITWPPQPGNFNFHQGFHGFYAYAEKGVSNVSTGELQPRMPLQATARVASDQTAPKITGINQLNGLSSCPQEGDLFRCIDTATGHMTLEAHDPSPGSGIDRSDCAVNGNGSSFPLSCPPGDVFVPLGDGDGLKIVDVRVVDLAGNGTTAKSTPPPGGTQPGQFGMQALWLVDLKKPDPPTLDLNQIGTNHNGWYHVKPTLSVEATDNPPLSGFADDAIVLTVDDSDKECGTVTPPLVGRIRCSQSAVAGRVPASGRHTFEAYATDRVGHRSDTQTRCAETVVPDTCTMQVDAVAPSSRFFITPEPKSGWYSTRPFFAFAATDTAGGSGLDPEDDVEGLGTGIRYRIDNGGLVDYEPTEDEVNRLPEGRHEVSFFAKDVAQNSETEHCQHDPCKVYKVDTTAPVTSLGVSPSVPDGLDGYHTTPVTFTPDGAEVVPPELTAADVSGLAKVEYQVDNGPWKPAAPFTLNEQGRHEVRVRARDVAGNEAPITQRVVFIDLHAPTVRMGTYPPAANAAGYFRQPLQHALISTDVGDGSGADRGRYHVDGGAVISYLLPFSVGDGQHTVTAWATDHAGLTSSMLTKTSRIDTRAPVARIAGPAPVFSSGQATLGYSASDALTPKVRVGVLVFDSAATFVRRIEVPGPDVDPGQGSVTWDGRRSDGSAVPSGLYHYRVQVTDQAGNTAISTESAQFQVGSSLGGLLRVTRLDWASKQLAVRTRCRGARRCQGVVRVLGRRIRASLKRGARRSYRLRMRRRPPRHVRVRVAGRSTRLKVHVRRSKRGPFHNSG